MQTAQGKYAKHNGVLSSTRSIQGARLVNARPTRKTRVTARSTMDIRCEKVVFL